MSLKNNSAEDVESHNRLFDASFYESKLYQFSPDTPAEQSTVAALQLMAATLSLRPNETSQLFVHDIIHKTQQVLLTDQKEGKVRSDTLGKWWESSNSDNVTIGTDDVWVDVAEIAAQASKFDDTLSKLSGAIKVTEAFKVGLKPQEVPAVSNSSFFRKTMPPGRHATNSTHTSSQKPIRSQQVSKLNTSNTTPNPSTTKSQDSAGSNGLDWKLLQNTKLISKGIPKVDSHTVVLLDGSPCRPPPASKRTKFSYENSESQEEENSQHTGEHWNKRQHLRNGTSDDSQMHVANQWKNKQSQQSSLQQLNNRQTNQVQYHRNHEPSQAQFHRNHEPSQAQFNRNHEASGKFESRNQQQPPSTSAFVTAKQKYTKDQRGKMTGHFQSNQQHGNGNHAGGQNNMNNSNRGRSLGGYGRRRNFRPPARLQDPQDNCPQQPRNNSNVSYGYGKSANNSTRRPPNNNSFHHGNRGFNPAEAAQKILRDQNNSNGAGTADQDDSDIDPRLKHIDPALVERIESEVLDSGTVVSFDDIAGLEFAKQNIEEAVVWPIRNPELYTGLRVLPKGLLLFGPPGTGKTMIGKAIAHQVSATFFSISASSLTSKWIGEGEKMVRAMFAVAGVRSPSVVFIDEIDSLLTQRTSEENEASRRIKTEFLVQLDGAATSSDEMVLVIGATNRPQELDEAARRRFVKRLYIPLPEADTRRSLLLKLLAKNDHSITDEQLNELVENTKGYSGADVTNLAREASMGPLRELMRKRQSASGVEQPGNSDMRPISSHDFTVALKSIRASVSQKDLSGYVDWNNEFGTQAYMG